MPHGPLEIYKKRLKSGELQSDTQQERAVESLQRLYDRLTDKIPRFNFFKKKKAEPQGVYLYGGVGRGKSMTMDLFFSSLPENLSKRRVHFHAFMIEVHDYIHARREHEGIIEEVDDVLMSLAARLSERVRVLCFDEFHVSDVADAMILGRLFTALFEHGVVVVATSNWPPDRLYEGGLQRDRFLPFIELLKRKLEIIEVNGPVDYRARALSEEGTYFTPLDKSTHEKVENLFAQLTDNVEARMDVIEVKGRKIPVRAANGVARFVFSELCARALGAEDYLALAQNYRTVFLEDVPVLASEDRNEAKRLMILIDALYESRTKLVVSADSEPEGIYSGSDHGYDFQRTVSRLLEMQSPAYLEKP